VTVVCATSRAGVIDFVRAFTSAYAEGVSQATEGVGAVVTRPRPARLVRRDRATRDGIPEATVSRLPLYLQALTALAERGVATVSSEELAAAAGVGSAKLRKDLSHLGSYGTRGVGYEVEYLVNEISSELGLTQDWRVVIVGVGNLGHALANYAGFATRGFTVVALFDAAESVVGEEVAGLPVRSVDELADVVAELGIQIGVVATPAGVAQEVCDRMVAAGVTGVLNFAPCVLSVPDGVMVRRVDLSTELQILAFHEQRKVATRLAETTEPVGTPPHGTVLPDPAAFPGAREARASRAGAGR
jgi:redox-sensing transcriptional repressor